MTFDPEVAIRTALDALVVAILAAVRAELAPVPGAADRLLSIDQAATALGIGRTALYSELTSGRLRSFKVGRRRLIPDSAVDAYIEVRAADPAPPAHGRDPGTAREAVAAGHGSRVPVPERRPSSRRTS